MADVANRLEFELVHQLQEVIDQLLLVVASRRRVGPSVTAQVRHDQPPAANQRDDPAPAVPVLRPPVEQHEGRAGADLGDMDREW
jgi:hypothetical protein